MNSWIERRREGGCETFRDKKRERETFRDRRRESETFRDRKVNRLPQMQKETF